MSQDYYPSGPFLELQPDKGDFDREREDFLLDFSEPTARAYRADLEDYYEWCQASGKAPLKAGLRDRDAYVESLRARGYAARTIARRDSVLRRFLA